MVNPTDVLYIWLKQIIDSKLVTCVNFCYYETNSVLTVLLENSKKGKVYIHIKRKEESVYQILTELNGEIKYNDLGSKINAIYEIYDVMGFNEK